MRRFLRRGITSIAVAMLGGGAWGDEAAAPLPPVSGTRNSFATQYAELAMWAASQGLVDAVMACQEAIERLGGVVPSPGVSPDASVASTEEFKVRWDRTVEGEAAAVLAEGDIACALRVAPDLPVARAAAGSVCVPSLGWLEPADAERFQAGLRPDGIRWLAPDDLRARGRGLCWPDVWSVHGEWFRIRTDASYESALSLLGEAESLRRTWSRLTDGIAGLDGLSYEGPVGPLGPDRMEIRHFRRRVDFAADARAVSPGQESGPGFFCSGDGVARFVHGGGGGTPDVEILRHEVTHQILVMGWGLEGDPTTRPHFWAMEGAGTYAQGFRASRETVPGTFAGRAHPWHAAAASVASRGRHVPLTEFFAMDARAFMARPVPHYQQAYALTAYLAGAYPARWIRYLREVHTGAASADSFERHFGFSGADLEREWLASLR